MSTQQVTPTRLDTFLVNLQVEDPHSPGQWFDWGVWDTKAGGDLDSEERIYYPGGMYPSYSLGGRVVPAQITLTRNYRIHRDHYHIQNLLDAVGVSRVTIQQFPMDRYKNVYTPALVWHGTLKTVILPEHNSESTSDPGMITVVASIDSAPSAVGANAKGSQP